MSQQFLRAMSVFWGALFLCSQGLYWGFAVGSCQRQDGLNGALVLLSSGNLALNGCVFLTVVFLSFVKSVIHVRFQTHSKHNWGNI